MEDHYTTEQLKARGWSGSMIKTHLGQPDERKPDPTGRLRKSIELYRIERVHACEVDEARADLEKLSQARALAKRALQLKKSKLSE